MAYSISFTKQVRIDSQAVGRTANYAPTRVLKFDEDIPAASTNLAFKLSIDVSELQVLAIQGAAAMTIKTNNSGTPDDTITIGADNPVVECVDDGAGFSVTVDVNTIYVTSTAGGRLQIIAGEL